jgi:YidC/Oxa1 family membrane protein insertase
MLDKLSMEVRMLIAMLLVGIVFALSQYFMPPTPDPATQQTVVDKNKAAKAAQASPAVAAAPTTPGPTPGTADVPGAIQAANVEDFSIDTDLFKVNFSNHGAVVRNWVLKAYKDSKGQPLELVNQRAMQLTGNKALPPPFALAFKTPPSNDPNDDLYRVTRSGDGLGVTFDFADGRITSKKTFQFAKNSYLVKITSQVMENGVLIPHSLVWRGGFGDSTGSNPTADAKSLYYDEANKSLEKKTASDAKDGPVSASGTYAFAGIEDKYFAGVALLGTAGSLELTTYSDTVPSAAGKDEAHVGAGVGGSGNNTFQLYAGPKDIDLLKTVDPRLPQVIDWGWFFFIAKPLFYVLQWTSNTVTHNYGWAIILITIVINTILFPLRLSSMKSSKKMQSIQPLVKQINDKYAGLSMNDPKKADQNAELMDLYKKHDINPVGGCLPMLLQIPFFYALYKVLSLAIEMRGAEWLWVANLAEPETWAIRILPLLLVVTQFLSQKMTPQPGMEPSQQKIMMFMPLMFGYMFWYASAGLVLYWLTSNVVSIAQQWLLNRNTPAAALAVVVPPKKKK